MKKGIKRIMTLAVVAVLGVTSLTGCSGNEASNDGELSLDHEISVVSREDGSGTRGAFVELFGVEVKDANGDKVDMTTLEASITSSTSVMMTTVAGDPYAIGYISLGSLNDTVKALKIDGVDASVENIKNGEYKVARPFNIATKTEVSEVTQDFINFIMSAEGQAVVTDAGYIGQDGAASFTSTSPKGKISVGGSSSVTPVMEKLKEAYVEINPNVEIEIQQTDSTTGMTSTIDGICDIGMASRTLKDSEVEKGLQAQVIAMDGIAVIVNNEFAAENLTSEQVRQIFTGEVYNWADVLEE